MSFPCFVQLARGSTRIDALSLVYAAARVLLLPTLIACEPSPRSESDGSVGAASPSSTTGLDAASESAAAPSLRDASPLDAASPAQDAAPLDAAGSLSDAGQDSAPALDASVQADALAEPAKAGAADASGDALPTFAADGLPLEAKDGVWTYIEFPDTTCRDGSRAGVSLSRSASNKLMIYLEGGIYCFDELTCAFNPANVDETLFNSAKIAPTEGIFDRGNPANPVRDWSIVYVPYCSGDGHGGTKTVKTDVPNGPKGQYFSGQLNLEKFLRRVVPTFKSATDVLLTGMSAGGFGVLQTAALVQRAFPWLKVRHVNDSGPPISKAVAPECMQQKMRTMWGYELSSLAACGASCPNENDYFQDNALFLARSFADRPAGFIDSEEDEPMRMFFGIGLNGCTGSLLFDSVPAETYRSDLLSYRDKLKAFPAYGTFIAKGVQHTWLKNNSFYTESVGDTKLVDWFAKIAKGEAAGHVGP